MTSPENYNIIYMCQIIVVEFIKWIAEISENKTRNIHTHTVRSLIWITRRVDVTGRDLLFKTWDLGYVYQWNKTIDEDIFEY